MPHPFRAGRKRVKFRLGRTIGDLYGRPGLLLDVLLYHRDRGASNRTGEVRTRPQPDPVPVGEPQVFELLADHPRRDAFEAVDQLGYRDFRREVD